MTSTTLSNLEGAAASRENNFRIIRHIAAAAVIFGHSFIVNGGLGTPEPWEPSTGISLAAMAVNIFFVTSGFLVTQSILARRDLVAYVLSRALRIYPALITVVCLSALVMGPLLTALPAADYLSRKAVYAYVVYDATSFSPLSTRYELPGMFSGNPYPGVVNASLWTLPWEIWMYVVLAALYVVGALRGAWLLIGWAALMAAHFLVTAGLVETGQFGGFALRLGGYFFTGAAFYRYRFLFSPTLARQAVATAVFAAFVLAGWQDMIMPLFVSHSVLFLALYRPLVIRSLSDGFDFSYGIYLYAYPVQQVLVSALGPHDPYLGAVLALAATIPLAAASWYLIERPALSFKPVLIGKSIVWRNRAREAYARHGRRLAPWGRD